MSTVVPGYEFKKPIRDKVQLRSQSETRFKIWTKYRHGSEILNGRGQRPLSSLRVFAFAVSLDLSALGPLEPGYIKRELLVKKPFFIIIFNLSTNRDQCWYCPNKINKSGKDLIWKENLKCTQKRTSVSPIEITSYFPVLMVSSFEVKIQFIQIPHCVKQDLSLFSKKRKKRKEINNNSRGW